MKLHSRSDSETRDIGRKIGGRLKRGDVVCLYGELGAGKTTMVKGIASALGIKERDITSASFTMIAEYGTAIPFYHIDLYRLAPGEAPELGLQEYLGPDAISVIEWAEKAGDEIPDDSIRIHFRHTAENVREIDVEGLEL